MTYTPDCDTARLDRLRKIREREEVKADDKQQRKLDEEVI